MQRGKCFTTGKSFTITPRVTACQRSGRPLPLTSGPAIINDAMSDARGHDAAPGGGEPRNTSLDRRRLCRFNGTNSGIRASYATGFLATMISRMIA